MTNTNQFLFPHIVPGFGKHARNWSPEDLNQEREQYLSVNRQILPGFGKHRKNREYAA